MVGAPVRAQRRTAQIPAASEAVRDAQARWEDAGAALVARVDAAVAKATKEGIELDVDEAFGDAFDAHAEAVRRAWWDLADDIVLRLADGFITDPASKEPPGKAGVPGVVVGEGGVA